GVDPDVVVGERRMGDRVRDARHVAVDAVACRPDRAAFRGRGAVALEALGLVERGRALGVAVWVVAGHAIEGAAAFGVATAAGEGRGLEPYRVGIGGGDSAPLGAVALPAKPDDWFARGELGPGNRQVDEPSGNGFQVVTARPVTPLAADAAVARERPGVGP